ncbi:MAG: 5-bromo-4-chloroindolyl phosphate hydrolysis family protein [Gammaproteobacteria bacterium]|nr:5-bromo-4-chloroindolyl phosphate hydrolysis family protein [Gammaproteobacteria bacterium]
MRSDIWQARGASDELARVRRIVRDAQSRLRRPRPTLGLRGWALYLLAAPLLPAAVFALADGAVLATIGAVAAFALIAGGARLNRRGMLERQLAPERRFTATVRFPFQLAAVAMVAFGTMIAAALVAGHDTAASLLFGVVAAAGMVIGYAVPAPRLRRPHPRHRIEDPAQRRLVQEAEQRLLAIERAALSIGNPELERHLARVVDEGQQTLLQLAQRPSDLHRARRFFHVHLEGAERVAGAYAKAHRILRDGTLEAKFRNVLMQIATAFRRQREQLAANDIDDLDIQIEVLRKQLQREGIA